MRTQVEDAASRLCEGGVPGPPAAGDSHSTPDGGSRFRGELPAHADFVEKRHHEQRGDEEKRGLERLVLGDEAEQSGAGHQAAVADRRDGRDRDRGIASLDGRGGGDEHGRDVGEEKTEWSFYS